MKEFVINSPKLCKSSPSLHHLLHNYSSTLDHNNLTNPHEVNIKSKNEHIQHSTSKFKSKCTGIKQCLQKVTLWWLDHALVKHHCLTAEILSLQHKTPIHQSSVNGSNAWLTLLLCKFLSNTYNYMYRNLISP